MSASQTPRRRCFVISPIGEEGSEIREHADDVFDYVIKPAMDECGIDAFRSDHLSEPGMISQQMFNEILNDDLCIAVITFHNPNVFYELAIAQAAARPVIVMLQKPEKPPFDIQDLRVVSYDLKPRSLMDGAYVKEIVKQVRGLEAGGWKGKAPFGDRLAGADGDHHQLRFLPKTGDYGSSNAWGRLLDDSESAIDLMGIGLFAWRRTKGFRQTVAEKTARGCKIRMLLMHPDNPALRGLINEAREEDPSFVPRELGPMFDWLSGLADEHENFAVRRMLRGTPHWQLVKTDRRAVCIPYLYSEPTSQSPLWECGPGHALYGILQEEFETLWEVNPEPAP
jgi:hypothetical protein